MREVGQKLGLNMYVFGPETHMTAIVGMALGTRPISRVQFRQPTPEPPSQKKQKMASTGNMSVSTSDIQSTLYCSSMRMQQYFCDMCIHKGLHV